MIILDEKGYKQVNNYIVRNNIIKIIYGIGLIFALKTIKNQQIEIDYISKVFKSKESKSKGA